MVRTPSLMTPLGTKAANFNLIEPLSNQFKSLDALRGNKATVIMFICNHCPFVIHIIEAISEISKTYSAMGIGFIAINSNDIHNYPADAPPLMKTFIQQYDLTFPYLFDETQAIAKAYNAACTPDFFVFDDKDALIYRGQFDDSRPGNDVSPSGESLTTMLDALLNGERLDKIVQKPSLGCNIKWLPTIA